MNPISLAVFVIFAVAGALAIVVVRALVLGVALIALAVILGYGIKMARQWEKAVVLRVGKLSGVYGPGLFFIIPIIDTIAAWIDQRIQTTAVNAEQALTRDTVPVNVDAIIFWVVHDTERAAL